MKLLFLLHDFLPEHAGGTEVHTARLAAELARRGHSVAVACTERDLARADGDVREREHEGLRVIEVAHAREYACAEETWEEPRQLAVLERILGAERPDVLHVQHFAQWGTGALRVAARAGIPSVVTLHDYHLLCANACLLRSGGELCRGDCADCLESLPSPRAGAEPRALERAAEERRAAHRRDLALAQVVISPSRFLAELAAERGLIPPERVVRIESGVEGPWREPRESDPRAPLRIAYAGGIYPSKGVHVLLEAFGRLEPGSATLDLHGVLDWFPSYVGHLRTLAGGRADVQFRGRFEPRELDGILEHVDVLAVPSLWYENRPLTMQDAFRRGVCVVASDLGGMAELLAPGRGGLLFPRGDAVALARLLSELAGDRPRVAALARARPPLASLAEVADRHVALYAGVLRGPRPVP